jgi:xanthine phosphoribosyltransferase
MTHDYTTASSATITWSRLHRDVRDLADRLAPLGPFRGIVAVARGGLIPAGLIARYLGLRHVDTVCVASYDDRVQGEPRIVKPIDGDGHGWLVIDDLVDSGITARIVREMLPKAHYATVYAKPQGRPLVHTHAVDVDQHVWLVFPWDSEPVVD